VDACQPFVRCWDRERTVFADPAQHPRAQPCAVRRGESANATITLGEDLSKNTPESKGILTLRVSSYLLRSVVMLLSAKTNRACLYGFVGAIGAVFPRSLERDRETTCAMQMLRGVCAKQANT
jgi:hypothetical protein